MSKRPKPDQKQLFHSLSKDLRDLVHNEKELKVAVNNFFGNLVDELVIGIIFDLHRKYKTNAYELDDSQDEEDERKDVDIIAQHNRKKIKKTQVCMCPNCDQEVAASRFAPHLTKCMGMGRNAYRTATRRVTTNSKEKDYCELSSDNDDDPSWDSKDKPRKKRAKNGSKKTKGTPKKGMRLETGESLNVDVEGDDDDLTNFRDILHLQDHSNSSSPADSATSSNSGSSKKKDKSKSKKSSKRDRSSPSSSLTME